MEVEISKEGQSHRPLTQTRVIRGVLCLFVLLSTAFMLLVYCGFWAATILRLFSVHHSRRASGFFFGCWIALWPFLFEKINKTKVVLSGDKVPAKERALLIANHRTEVDWMYLWDLALRKGCQGCVKYILKSSLMKLPVFGWVFHVMEFVPVERKWVVDASMVHRMLSKFTDPRDPLWLVVFPEGTDFTEKKCKSCQTYASENGLPILKNVLLPKTKGFYACLANLRSSLDAVYDVSIGYRHRCPSFLDNVFGVDPSEVHIHVSRIPLSEIPTSELEVSSWLMNTFSLKDQLLSDFYREGHFPREGYEQDLALGKCLVNFIFVMILTGTCTFLTIFSSIWFRIYVSLVCAYMTAATCFNIRPQPIFGF